MQVQHYDPTPDGRRLIKHATIDFDRQNLVFIDSPISHDFSFTPAVSLFINLPNEEALEQAFHRLAEGGKVLMPLDDYGFSARFGWLNDRFGLSWQLNVPAGICPDAKGSVQNAWQFQLLFHMLIAGAGTLPWGIPTTSWKGAN